MKITFKKSKKKDARKHNAFCTLQKTLSKAKKIAMQICAAPQESTFLAN